MSVSVMGVVGAGFMGSGIAEATAVAGKFAIVYEPEDAPLARSRSNLSRSVNRAVARGKLSAEAATGVLERIVFTTRFEDLCAADAVVESITEDAKIKASSSRAWMDS